MSEQEIYIDAMNRQDAAERRRFLDQACGENSTLRARLEKLIQHSDRVGSFLEHPPEPLTMTAEAAIEAEVIGTQIGPYRIRQQIGEGGFGVVFLAEQDRPVHRRVALKIIKPGMDTREVIARFEAERQALAMMDHPNIAKVYDAGGTEIGRPYFVMELVQGVPITEYCDQCNLTTRDRLELFITVCQAVQHAHQKGVIHRDIKPTNVLVAVQDGRPTPKIIDFGVAKALSQRLTEHTLMTAFAQMVGTPLYMSPEQAELSPLGVDTRSDIYSLGVLLYELLTGTTPFDKDRLHAASYDELRRIIREEEAPRPSARISTLAAELADTVAEHRRTDSRRLRQTVDGELDWIVMKCLEKDRNRRYETPNGLARDIERHLHDEPVQACPPSTSYRFRKFARRNKTLLAAGGAIAAALLVGLGLSTWMYIRERAAVQIAKANEARATTESARAKAISDLLQKMLASSNPDQLKGSKYTVRELLDEFSAKLGDRLAGEPEVEATIRSVIGKSYWRLGVPDRAGIHLKKSLDMQRKLFGDQDERVADILLDYSWNLAEQNRFAEAETHAREALSICHKRNSDPHLTMRALWSLARFLFSQSRLAEAEQIMNEALALAGDGTDTSYEELPNILHTLADTKASQGKFEEAEKCARRSVDFHRRMHGNHHPETAWGLLILGRTLAGQKKLADAKPPLREALAIFREYYTPDHHSIQGVTQALKSVLDAKGDRAGLDALASEEVEQASRPDMPGYHARLAGLLMTNRPSVAQKDEARRLIRRAMEENRHVTVDYANDFNRRLKAAEGYVGLIKICAGAPNFAAEVDELNRRLAAELPAVLAAFPASTECQWLIAHIFRDWAFELIANSTYLPTIEHALSESIEIFEKLSLSEPERPGIWFYLANTFASLGDTQWRLDRVEDADATFRRAMEIYDAHAAEIAKVSTALTIEIPANYIRFAKLLLTSRSQTKRDEARRLIRQAMELSGQVAIDSRDDLELRMRVADQYVEVAKVCGTDPDFVDLVSDAHRRLIAELPDMLLTVPESSDCQSKVAERFRLWSDVVPNNATSLPSTN